VYIKLNTNFIFTDMNLRVRDSLINVLNRISRSNEIRALVIINQNERANLKKYNEISKHVNESKYCHRMIHSLCNILDQIILTLVSLNKFIIHSDGSKFIPLFFNLSLACDYRIISSHAVYQKTYFELGGLPKGGCAFFLCKMLGSTKAKKLLLSSKEILALEALKLGIVDQVVPIDQLERASIQTAKHIAKLPGNTVIDIKKLVNFAFNGLEDYLKLESKELLKNSGLYDYF
jgi:enoyl-CoA hydratase/carnithine racemase